MTQSSTVMNNVFWGLNEDWWKQIYDGKYHQFGCEVFDKGLHGNNKEPGFYSSIKRASEYASQQMGNLLTIECYKRIHQLACEHFLYVERNAINVDKNDIDKFRNTYCSCFRNLMKDNYEYENSEQSEKRRQSFVLLNQIRWDLLLRDGIETKMGSKEELNRLPPEIRERIFQKFTNADFFTKKMDVVGFFEKGNLCYEEALESMEKVKEQLSSSQIERNLPKPLVSLKIDATGEEKLVFVNYNYQNPIEIEEALHKLINDYNEKIRGINSDPYQRNVEENELALKCIAELFQNLEWLHPYFDGQGRTDLVLLAKLLTENGFNPCILYFPYFSTFEPLEKWVSYIKEGMEAWKKELKASTFDSNFGHQ